MKFTVVKNLHKREAPALYPEISEREMCAIGKMTVSWALLESQIIKTTLELAKHIRHVLPADFEKNNNLQKTLKEFKTLITLIEKPEELKTSLQNVIKRVNRLKVQRHLLTHGIFTWEIIKPQQVRVQTPKAKQQSHSFNADKIEALARKIAELNFEIMYPSGEEQFINEKAETGYGMSRRYAILATEAESNDPTLALTTGKENLPRK